MADLRALLSDLGFTAVATLLNSGNAAVTATEPNPAVVAGQIEEALSGRFRLSVAVIVRSEAQVAAAIERNPMPAQAEQSPKLFHVGFCDPAPTEALGSIDRAALGADRFELDGDTLYVWFADGVRNSALARILSARGIGEHVTLRNWNTVGKLLALARA